MARRALPRTRDIALVVVATALSAALGAALVRAFTAETPFGPANDPAPAQPAPAQEPAPQPVAPTAPAQAPAATTGPSVAPAAETPRVVPFDEVAPPIEGVAPPSFRIGPKSPPDPGIPPQN
jgi:hypothetical protein